MRRLSGAAGPAQLTFLSPDGNVYQTMPLAFVTTWTVKISLDGQLVHSDSFVVHLRQ